MPPSEDDTITISKIELSKIYHEALHLMHMSKRRGDPMMYMGTVNLCRHIEDAAPYLKGATPLRD